MLQRRRQWGVGNVKAMQNCKGSGNEEVQTARARVGNGAFITMARAMENCKCKGNRNTCSLQELGWKGADI